VRHGLEKMPVQRAVPAELELLAGCPAAPGSASKLASRRVGRWFVAGGPFVPADFARSALADIGYLPAVDFARWPSPESAELVAVANRPEPVLAAALFASIAPFFAGRSPAIRAPPELGQASLLSLAVPSHSAATFAVGPLPAIDRLLG